MRWDRRVGVDVGIGLRRRPPRPTSGRCSTAFTTSRQRGGAARRHFGLTAPGFRRLVVVRAAAGHVVFLQVLDPAGEVPGPRLSWGRLTYSHSGDRADLRREHPGSCVSCVAGDPAGHAERQTAVDLCRRGRRRCAATPARRRGDLHGLFTCSSARSARRGSNSRVRRNGSPGQGATPRGEWPDGLAPRGRAAGRSGGIEGHDERPRGCGAWWRRGPEPLGELTRLGALCDAWAPRAWSAGAGDRPGLGGRVAAGPRPDVRLAAPSGRGAVRRGAGRHVDGHDFVAGAGGRAAGRARRAPARGSRSRSLSSIGLSRRSRRGGVVVRRPEPRAGGRRDHRHGRQDHDLVPRRGGARGGRALDGAHRDRRHEDRAGARIERGARHHALRRRSSRRRSGRWSPPATPPRSSRRRRTVSRPRPGRRDRLRRGDPHEPHPRAPRVPRHVGGVPGRQAVALRAPRRGRQPRPGPGRAEAAIVNADDPDGRLFVGVAQEAGARVLTYGTDPAADVRATRVEEDARRLRIAYDAPSVGAASSSASPAGSTSTTRSPVVALGEALGLDPAAVRAGLESVEACPAGWSGSMPGQPFGVVIDYAHSPASLEAVLELLGPVAAARGGELIAVFGSAGERDTAKRPMMGRIAGERVPPRRRHRRGPARRGPGGDPRRDRARRRARGARRGHDLLLIADRAAAIEAAFERARPGDIVLLAGKGHEQSIIGPAPVAYDERGAALDALARLGYGAGRRRHRPWLGAGQGRQGDPRRHRTASGRVVRRARPHPGGARRRASPRSVSAAAWPVIGRPTARCSPWGGRPVR